MGRQCYYPGCKNTSGLHTFPADPEIRCQWLCALGLPDQDLPPRAGVCNQHFSRDCFANLMQVEMGYAKLAVLKSNAVPTVVPTPLPQPTLSGQLHLLPSARLRLEVSGHTYKVILALLDVWLVMHYIIFSSNFHFRAEISCCIVARYSAAAYSVCITWGGEKSLYLECFKHCLSA